MQIKNADIGMVGLGVMGRNLVMNMVDHGFSVAGYDNDPEKVQSLEKEAGGKPVGGVTNAKDLVDSLRVPRAIMMMVPAGSPVNSVIHDLLPLLTPGDILIDGGNSFYKDTDLRASMLAEKNITYLGIGISGGEDGARFGPSMMPGGHLQAYKRVQPIFEAIAAHVNGDPCVTYLGPGSAGHFVKMVHNGIEYGIIELIAEAYDLMKRGLGMNDDDLHTTFKKWNSGPLASFLIEITADVFSQVDERTGRRLIDVILDEASQKGTGKWTSQEALDLQVPAPTIDIAVMMRDMSILKPERTEAGKIYKAIQRPLEETTGPLLQLLPGALYAAFVTTFAMGFEILQTGSSEHQYDLKLADIARIWRGGCIIRANLLDQIMKSYQKKPDLANLLLDSDFFSKELLARQSELRRVAAIASQMAIPAPALMVSLSYLDAYTSEWLPANLIQAQRDYFGAHTYERIDDKGKFHTHWTHE